MSSLMAGAQAPLRRTPPSVLGRQRLDCAARLRCPLGFTQQPPSPVLLAQHPGDALRHFGQQVCPRGVLRPRLRPC